MPDPCLLVGDIGGTNARFGLACVDKPGFTDQLTLKCADFESADLAINQYLQTTGASDPDVICVAAAGPVVDQRVRLTNNSWSLSAEALSQQFADAGVRILNDFEAIAYSIPFLDASDCRPVGQSLATTLDAEHFMVGVLGPGTGLGAVGLRKFQQHYIPITGEASHCGFAPESPQQAEILAVLRERFKRVSSERLVSGGGLENIYWALARLQKASLDPVSAADIFTLASEGSDARAVESVALFFEIFGQIAGDLALTLGAEDGIFIAGGIVQRYPDMLEQSAFRSGFENKGRHRSLMERISTQVIMHRQPGLLGASYCARELNARNTS